jgi:hypothetical protein
LVRATDSCPRDRKIIDRYDTGVNRTFACLPVVKPHGL